MNTRKNLPPPLATILSELPKDHLDSYQECFDAVIGLFGEGENRREHASASLAGLITITAALKESPVEIIFRNLNSSYICWESGVVLNADYLVVPINSATSPEILLKASLHLNAGIAGTTFASLNYPLAFPLDIYLSSVCTCYLDALFGLPFKTFALRVMDLALHTLSENEKIFQALFSRFCLGPDLDLYEIKEISKGVNAIDLGPVLKGLQ
jgi:hypothetical protein